MKRNVILLLALAVGGCGETGVEPGLPTPIQFTVVAGDAQTAPAYAELGEPLVVLAEQGGKPWKGKVVNFVVTGGGGRVFAGSALTDNKGMAREYWTLGHAGPQELQVRAVDNATGAKLVFATFTATALAPPPVGSRVQCKSGDGTWQHSGSCGWPSDPVGSTVPTTFRAVGPDGVPFPGAVMTFVVDPTCLGYCDNAGSVAPAQGITDAQGEITVMWTLGPNPGSNRLQAGIPERQTVGVWRGGH